MNATLGSAAGFLLLLINIAPCLQLNIPNSRLLSDDSNINEKVRTDGQRPKKALSIHFVYQILRGAKFTGTNRFSIEQYAKAGGFKNALQDFESVKFADVRKGIERVPQWQFGKKDDLKNPVWIGDIGNTRLELMKYPDGLNVFDATITIKEPWSSPLPQKIIYYRN